MPSWPAKQARDTTQRTGHSTTMSHRCAHTASEGARLVASDVGPCRAWPGAGAPDDTIEERLHGASAPVDTVQIACKSRACECVYKSYRLRSRWQRVLTLRRSVTAAAACTSCALAESAMASLASACETRNTLLRLAPAGLSTPRGEHELRIASHMWRIRWLLNRAMDELLSCQLSVDTARKHIIYTSLQHMRLHRTA